MKVDQVEVLNFQNQRVFAILSRDILCLFEDLKVVHDINFNKLKNNLPEECAVVVDISNYLDEASFSHLRKRILDRINSAKRDLDFSVNDIF